MLCLIYGLNNDAFASLVFENSTGYNATYVYDGELR